MYRDVVMKVMHILDPNGVQQRAKHKLSRRVYFSKVTLRAVHLS